MPKHDYSSWKPLNLKCDSLCAECGVLMPTRTMALWSRGKNLVVCSSHGESSGGIMEPGLNGKQVTNRGLKLVTEKLRDPEVAKEVEVIQSKMNLDDSNQRKSTRD